MHVALVCPYALDVPGGVQDQVFRLGGWLGEIGHTSTVIGPGSRAIEGAVVVGEPTDIRSNNSVAPIAFRRGVGSAVREAVAQADVVHIHEPLVPAVSLAATRIQGIPTVGTFHADASRMVRRGLSLARPVTRGVTSRLDVKTAVSPIARSSVKAIAEVRIIPNGIDVSDYAPGEKRSNAVVFLGRDDPRKGLDVLLEAWPAIRARSPYATLDILGADRDVELDGVIFHGRVGEDTKMAVLGRSAVHVAPNLGGESFGIVLAEGMAAGCAIVASALPAFVRVVGDAGRLVPVADPGAIADAVADLLEDDADREALAEAALERVRMFDGTVVAARYVEAYEDAIEAHGLRG